MAQLFIVLFCASSCCDAQEPRFYPGQVDGIQFRIPATELSVPALYEGESDWTPPLKPKADRTLADRLQSAEIETFDQSGLLMEPDPPGTVVNDGLPITIEVRFWSPQDGRRHYKLSPGFLLNGAKKSADQWGMDQLRSDRTSRKYNKAFDREYHSRDGLVRIICGNERLVVPPFSKMRDSCTMFVTDAQDHADVVAAMDARYLPGWQELERRMLAIVAKWRVPLS